MSLTEETKEVSLWIGRWCRGGINMSDEYQVLYICTWFRAAECTGTGVTLPALVGVRYLVEEEEVGVVLQGVGWAGLLVDFLECRAWLEGMRVLYKYPCHTSC